MTLPPISQLETTMSLMHLTTRNSDNVTNSIALSCGWKIIQWEDGD